MNVNRVREEMEKNIGKKVVVKTYGLRNKNNEFNGVIHATFSSIFTIINNGVQKSFSYADVITGETKIFYK